VKSAFGLLLCALVLGPATAWGQAPVGRVLRPNAVWHTVADLDRSVAFYRDAVGLSLEAEPRLVGGPSDIGAALGAAGATMRAATLLIPGADVRLTLVQFSGIAAAPVRQRLQDPGSVKLVVRVRDMDAAFSRVRNRVERVYTEGGMPIKPEGPAAVNTAVIMRDPDGYPLEFALQGTPPIAADVPAGSNIVGGWATFIVDDAAATVAFYRTQLDFQAVSEPRPLTPAALILQGTPTATGMSAGHRPPGAAATWRLYEFRNVDRARLSARLQDPGATAVSFWVDSVPALLARLKAAGGPAAEIGPTHFDGKTRAFVRDPNGLLLEFVEAGAR
jgi:catechol 2,3-dioxygenase-like lactoylglutathione lyase family enzyme